MVLAGNGARNHGFFAAEPVDTVKMRRIHHDFPKLLGNSPEIEGMLNYQAVSQSPNSKAPYSCISNFWGADIASSPETWWNVSRGVVLKLRMGIEVEAKGN